MSDRTPPPARVTLKQITVERIALYCLALPPRDNIPISAKPLPVEDSVLTEDYIEWEVQKLRSNLSGGPSGMMSEHFWSWLREARKAEESVEME